MMQTEFVPEFLARHGGGVVEVCTACPEFLKGKVAIRPHGEPFGQILLVSDTALAPHHEHVGRLAIIRQHRVRMQKENRHNRQAGQA